jgi:hypothetical protein
VSELVLPPSSALLVLVDAAGEHASMRFLGFFGANIRNPPRAKLMMAQRRDF